MKAKRIQNTIGILTVLTAVTVRAAGSLAPMGAPAPSMKTLEEMEPRTLISALPYTIQASGSYYLSGSLSGTQGIKVMSDEVTIDLNGFSLTAAPGAVPGNGIDLVHAKNVTVKNGHLSGWPANGIGRNYGQAYGHFQNIMARSNGFTGIDAAGTFENCVFEGNGTGMSARPFSRVENCRADNNTYQGFLAEKGVQLNGCTARNNGKRGLYSEDEMVQVRDSVFEGNLSGDAIELGDSALVESCTVDAPGGNGIRLGVSGRVLQSTVHTAMSNGIVMAEGGSVESCVVRMTGKTGIQMGPQGLARNSRATICAGYGFYLMDEGQVIDCIAVSNAYSGVFVLKEGRVTGVTASNNGNDGVYVGSKSRVDGVVATENDSSGVDAGLQCIIQNTLSYSNGWNGFHLAWESSVKNCSAVENSMDGFYINGGQSLLEDCLASDNGSQGFNVDSFNRILNCSALGNSWHGIEVESYCRLEGNTVSINSGNSSAILVDGVRNHVIGNTISSSTTGLTVDGTDNVIMKNMVHAYSDAYDIASGNSVAPIANIENGFNGSPAEMHPSANHEF